MRSEHPARAVHTFLICVLIIAAGLIGCDRSSPNLAKADALASARKYSLRETYDHLRDWYTRRAYWSIRPYIDNSHNQDVIDMLIAVDELLAANAGTQRAIRTACPTFPAERLDLSKLADNLDLFSREVRFVSAEENGSQGIVRVRIPRRIDPVDLRFEHRDGIWVYLPGSGGAEMVPVIREMTVAMDRISLTLASESKSPEDIGNEYRLRIGPKLKRITQLAGSAQ
jgi:hypothetical protein